MGEENDGWTKRGGGEREHAHKSFEHTGEFCYHLYDGCEVGQCMCDVTTPHVETVSHCIGKSREWFGGDGGCDDGGGGCGGDGGGDGGDDGGGGDNGGGGDDGGGDAGDGGTWW